MMRKLHCRKTFVLIGEFLQVKLSKPCQVAERHFEGFTYLSSNSPSACTLSELPCSLPAQQRMTSS